MTVLLDSWAWIEYLKDGPSADRIERYVKTPQDLIASAINIAEIKCFLLRHKREDLLIFITERADIVPVTADIAAAAAALKIEKRLGLADAIVLATAKAWGATVVTGDPDFRKLRDVVYLGK